MLFLAKHLTNKKGYRTVFITNFFENCTNFPSNEAKISNMKNSNSRSISLVLLVRKSICHGDGCFLGQPPVDKGLVRLAEDPGQPPVGSRGVAIAVGGPVPGS
jgi:hypothetical protein